MYLLCKIFQFKSREWVCILDSHKFCKRSFGYTLKPWNSKSQELLALGERIGNVNTGLPEEIVARQLKTRVYLSATNYINLEEPASKDQEPGSCIICQVIEAIAFQTPPPPPPKATKEPKCTLHCRIINTCTFIWDLQEDYRDNEKIGTLDCDHEYHAECLKKWLFIKNVCPICKSEALATKS